MICVVDVASTLAFYVERLGFAKQYAVDDPPRYAVVARDGQIVHFRQAETATPGNAFQLYIWTDGLDGFHAECVHQGAEVTRPPAIQPYGMREFAILDLNGIPITFAEEVD